jgi:hypothetical protein
VEAEEHEVGKQVQAICTLFGQYLSEYIIKWLNVSGNSWCDRSGELSCQKTFAFFNRSHFLDFTYLYTYTGLRCLREGAIRHITVTLSQNQASIVENLSPIQRGKDTVVSMIKGISKSLTHPERWGFMEK